MRLLARLLVLSTCLCADPASAAHDLLVLNIDRIVLTDRRPAQVLRNQQHGLTVEKRYLRLPLARSGREARVSLFVEGALVADYDIQAAEGPPESYADVDVSAWRGRRVLLEIDEVLESTRFFSHVAQADATADPPGLYREKYRPQFHFTPKTNWTNDPNGLVFYKGEYHLFFQHNPYGLRWGNMTWGHAVSPDLVHWTELADAIHPDRLGTIFSGSAVVDWENTAGFQAGPEKTIVSIYTSAGGTSRLSKDQPFTQSIAYSNDCGRSWKKYAKNPVLGHVVGRNRDPKVIWHAPSRRWIMVLFLDKNDFGLFHSPDLKHWTHLHDVTMAGSGECPDFFSLSVDGDRNRERWVLTSAKGDYLVGRFDGRRFAPETGPHPLRWGGNYYAVQSYSDIPSSDGRRVQVAWMSGGRYPDMPFNQQMSFPSTLTLRTCPEGLRIYREPVREIELLRTRTRRWSDCPVASVGRVPDLPELLDIEARIEPSRSKRVEFLVFGQTIRYETAEKKLVAGNATMDLEPIEGALTLRILVDRVTIDVFGNDGRVATSYCFLPEEGAVPLALSADGPARLVSLAVHELRSAWDRPRKSAGPGP